MAASSANYASFLQRAVAVILDGLIMIVPLMIVGFVLGGVMFASGSEDATATSLAGRLLGAVVYGAYAVFFIGSRGQTPGKMIMKIKVIDEKTGVVPGYQKALIREIVAKSLPSFVLGFLGGIGSMVSLVYFLLGYLWMLWDTKKQTLFDKIAGTVVVKV